MARCQTNTMDVGEIFGEIAALGRTQRLVTVLADGAAELLEIRWQGLRDIRLRDDAFRHHVDELYRERSLQGHLRETALFRRLPGDVLAAIAAETLFETYGNFDWHTSYKRFAADPPEVRLTREPVVVAEGDYPDGLLLIRSGFGRVTQRFNHGERTLRYLGRGGVFGLDEILRNWETGGSAPLGSTLRAVGYTDVLRVPTATVERRRCCARSRPRRCATCAMRCRGECRRDAARSPRRRRPSLPPRRNRHRAARIPGGKPFHQRHRDDGDRPGSLHALR